MNILFYIAGGVAVVSAAMAITRSNAVHALLYLVVSLLSTGLIFFVLGAPFAAALEVIVYAGAVMVLFVFVMMMLNLSGSRGKEETLFGPGAWAGPVMLTLVLAVEVIYVIGSGKSGADAIDMIGPEKVSAVLFGPYMLGVEIGSILLLAALVGAFHLAGKVGSGGEERGGNL
jgi:NADH-quinone oxidoreductase subunit J